MSYLVTLSIFISIHAIVACGLNVIVGYAGQISLGHAAFFGIGAYTAALLTTRGEGSCWVCRASGCGRISSPSPP